MGGQTELSSGLRPEAGSGNLIRLAALLLLVAVAGCDRKPAAESYYPLGPGHRWKYVLSGEVEAFAGWALHREGWKKKTASRDLDNYIVAVETSDTRKVKGVETTPFLASSNLTRTSWSTFAAKVDEGFADLAQSKRGKGEPEEFDTPHYFLRFPLREGRGWDVSEEVDFLDETIQLSGRSTITAVNETVTVPAGNFRHCVRVDTEMSGSKRFPHLNGRDMAGEATFDRQKTEWFAPEVGLVKATEKESITPEFLGNADQTLELTEFQRGKKQ